LRQSKLKQRFARYFYLLTSSGGGGCSGAGANQGADPGPSSASRYSADERAQACAASDSSGSCPAFTSPPKLESVGDNRIGCPVDHDVGQFERQLGTAGKSASRFGRRQPAMNRRASWRNYSVFGFQIRFQDAGETRSRFLVARIQRIGRAHQDACSGGNRDPP
jgi:hypothetical protein